MVSLPVKANGSVAYKIVMEEGFEGLAQAIAPLNLEGRKVCIVTDSTV